MIRGQVPQRRLERGASLQLLPAPGYTRSRAALGDNARTAGIVASLELRAASHPYSADAYAGTIVRVLHASRYGDFPALRLFYSVGDTAIWLLWVECFDEMEG